MTTLAEATLELARKLCTVIEGVATGGSTTTLIDTTRAEPDTYFTGGVIWFKSGNNAGKSAAVSSYSSTTDTFTFATQTGACASGNLYAASTWEYPRWLLISAINSALKTITLPQQQDISTVVVGEQEEYTLPTGVQNVDRVEILASSTDPYSGTPHYNWEEIDGTLVFDEGLAPLSGDLIRLTYSPAHTEISSDTSEISSYIHIDYLTWEAAVYALRWRMSRTKADDPGVLQQLNEAIARAMQAASLYHVGKGRDPHIARW